MNRKCTFLMLAALLLVGSVGNAGQTSSQADTMRASEAAIFSSEAPGCDTEAVLSQSPLESSSERAAFACGSCSVPACQGMFVGDICEWGPTWYYTCGVVNTCAAMGGGTGRFCDCPGNY